MRMLAFAAGRVRRRVVPAVLLLTLALRRHAAAQSFLGTIRGTVVDPQGAAVPGAAVLIIDEATGAAPHPRNRRRGPLRGGEPQAGDLPGRGRHHELQEVRADRRARARGRHRAGGRHARARQRQRNGDRHRPRRSTTSRSTARRSRAASTSSSCTTFRATAATSSRSCSSTRTSSAAATTTSSSSAARPTACRTSRTARPRRTRSSAPIGNSAPGPRRDRRRSRCSRTRTAPSTAAWPASS